MKDFISKHKIFLIIVTIIALLVLVAPKYVHDIHTGGELLPPGASFTVETCHGITINLGFYEPTGDAGSHGLCIGTVSTSTRISR